MRSCNRFHSHESPHSPTGRVGDIVAMLQIESPGIGNQSIAEAAGFQRCKRVFLAPHPIDLIEVFGADGSIRSQSDIKYNVEVDTKNIDVVMKKTLDNDKHIKFPKILIGVLTLIAVIIVFYFGGSIIETFYNIGRTLGNAIGDL